MLRVLEFLFNPFRAMHLLTVDSSTDLFAMCNCITPHELLSGKGITEVIAAFCLSWPMLWFSSWIFWVLASFVDLGHWSIIILAAVHAASPNSVEQYLHELFGTVVNLTPGLSVGTGQFLRGVGAVVLVTKTTLAICSSRSGTGNETDDESAAAEIDRIASALNQTSSQKSAAPAEDYEKVFGLSRRVFGEETALRPPNSPQPLRFKGERRVGLSSKAAGGKGSNTSRYAKLDLNRLSDQDLPTSHSR